MSDAPFTSPLPPKEPIDAQFEPVAPAAPPPKGPGWAALGLASLAAMLLGGAIGVYGADLVRPDRTAARLEAGLAGDRARIDALASEQATLAREVTARLAAIEPPAITAEDLSALLGELDAAAQRLDEAVAATGAGEAFADLQQRVAALETAPPPLLVAPGLAADPAAEARAARDARRADAALALSAIEAAARRGTGFEADYRALRAATPGNQAVGRLGRFIAGVPTLQSLQADFPAARTAALAAAAPAASGRLSWLEAVLGDSVSVRPAGPPTETAKTLDVAAKALAAGDLTACVTALAALEGPAARAMAGWTGRANQRITLEAALDTVRLGLIEGED